jgi:RHS repeat-associated protein
VYGKILEITRSPGDNPVKKITYSYDAQGNRISSVIEKSGTDDKDYTWYVRDAQGNTIAVYQATTDDEDLHWQNLNQTERHIYGSSRIGTFNLVNSVRGGTEKVEWRADDYRGYKRYELTNHLGNVLATISDKKFGVVSDTNSSLIASYLPEIMSSNSYYPFGSMMPGRMFSSGEYRYGFNGQEKSDEVKGAGNHYTAEFWEYDSRIGRRWNMDPIIKEYESPYAAFSNNPIWFIDPSGADTSKFLSRAQLVDALNVGYNVVKTHLDAKTFSLSGDYSSEVNKAVLSYVEKNKLNFGAATEFQQQALDYYKGFKEVAASIDGDKDFYDLGSKILNNENHFDSQKIIATQKLINERNGQAGSIAHQSAKTFTIIMGASTPNVGPGPRGVQTPPVGLKSNEFGRIIGWGEGQTQVAVQTTRNVTANLTRSQVQAFRNQGLTKEWVQDQLKSYNRSTSNVNKSSKNTQLLSRKELMEKILYLWNKKK